MKIIALNFDGLTYLQSLKQANGDFKKADKIYLGKK
jgi:hypothetical protein